MAQLHPSIDGRVRPARGGRVVAAAFSVVGVSALAAALVAALSLWLLLTDPIAAGAVVETGDVLPLARALLAAVGDALMSLLTLL